MNAQTPFRLEAPPLSSQLSRLNVSNEDILKDAAHQLRRCANPEDYRRWVDTWAEALIERCFETSAW